MLKTLRMTVFSYAFLTFCYDCKVITDAFLVVVYFKVFLCVFVYWFHYDYCFLFMIHYLVSLLHKYKKNNKKQMLECLYRENQLSECFCRASDTSLA